MSLPVSVVVEDFGLLVRQILRANDDFNVRMTGEYAGEYYSNFFYVRDLDIVMSYESSDLIEIVDTFTLDKPTVVIYYRKGMTDQGTVDIGLLTVEFQLVVNYKPNGYADLNGYGLLLQELVNPRTRKGLWLGYGLAPREVKTIEPANGSEIDDQLKDRLLIQSHIVTFSLTGVDA